MITGVLVTDGGPHSAEDWALKTAEMLCEAMQIDPNSPNRAKLEIARKRAEIDIAGVMLKHHGSAQSRERARLSAGGEVNVAPDHGLDIDAVVEDVIAAMKPLLDAAQNKSLVPGFTGNGVPAGMDFMDHLRRGVRERVEMDVMTIIKIERDYAGARP